MEINSILNKLFDTVLYDNDEKADEAEATIVMYPLIDIGRFALDSDDRPGIMGYATRVFVRLYLQTINPEDDLQMVYHDLLKHPKSIVREGVLWGAHDSNNREVINHFLNDSSIDITSLAIELLDFLP